MDVFHTPGAELLIQGILSLQTEQECRAFLEDLMTRKEIQDCSQRILVAKLLKRKLVYSRIAQETGASSATISRVNRCCSYGTGGYQTVLERLEANDNQQKENTIWSKEAGPCPPISSPLRELS